MVEAAARISRTFRLAAAPDEVWALLADVPQWGRLYPGVASIVPFPEAGADAYLWTMEPLGPPGGRVRTVYACRYHRQPAERTLTWTPVPGVGTAQFEGEARLEPHGAGTRGTLRLNAVLQIPAPRFMRGVVRPAVAAEMERRTDEFLERLGAVAG